MTSAAASSDFDGIAPEARSGPPIGALFDQNDRHPLGDGRQRGGHATGAAADHTYVGFQIFRHLP